jgi:hypothetical protein
MIIANPIQTQLSLDDFLKLPETKPAQEFINGIAEGRRQRAEGRRKRLDLKEFQCLIMS